MATDDDIPLHPAGDARPTEEPPRLQPAPVAKSLEEALAKYQVALFPPQIALLQRYFDLRNVWNERMNLTRHTDYDEFVSRDIVDSLSFAGVLQPDEVILDVGTGSGVPGIILAILRPDLRVVLCEAVGKRARAVADMCQQLGLAVPVWQGRVEWFFAQGGWQFHSLVIRAVAPLLILMRWFQPYWSAFDRLLVMKGPHWVEERGQARHYGVMHGFALRVVDRFRTPGTGAESVLLQICPEDRLLPPRGCRLRRLSYGELPSGLLLPDRPGPLAQPGVKASASQSRAGRQATQMAGKATPSKKQRGKGDLRKKPPQGKRGKQTKTSPPGPRKIKPRRPPPDTNPEKPPPESTGSP